MSAERALQVLPEGGNGALRATQPATLNDPFECASQFVTDNPNGAFEPKEIIEKLKVISPNARISENAIRSSLNDIGPQGWSQILREVISLRFGIVSFSANPLHPLLWAHYADSGKGVAIGYDIAVLKQIPTEHEILGAVQYSDQLPTTSESSDSLVDNELRSLLLKKSKHWQHEREWRLILDLRNTTGTGQKDENGFPICLCSIPNEAVVEVIITGRSPAGIDTALLDRLMGPYGFRGWPLERLVLGPDKYGYGYHDSYFVEGKYTPRIIYTRPTHPSKRPLPPGHKAWPNP